MEKLSVERRDFMKKMFTLSVFTAACPHVLLGKLEPRIEDDGGTQIAGIYELDTEQYKELQELYKTIRIDIPKKGGGAPIRVMFTKLDINVDKAHLAVFNEVCPHEAQKVLDILPSEKIFVCSGHGTVFNSRGGYIDGPAAKDLEIFQYEWNGTDRFITLLFPFYAPIKGIDNDPLFYLKNNYPNPFTEKTTLEFGLEKDSFIDLEIKDVLGKPMKSVKNGYVSSGHYTIEILTSDMPRGLYLCTMKINGVEKSSIKMIKQ